MAIKEYGPAGAIFNIGALSIDDWGDTDPAITFDDINPSSTITYGIGGKTVKHDTVTIPKTVVVNIKPGGDQSRAMNALRTGRVVVQGYFTQVGSGESITLIDGVVNGRGQVGRASLTGVTDDQFTIEFTDSVEI
jgi:hypothetical protein